ncbi:MAG: Flp pilus assembly complex ATPase component TadA [Phycisphaeraceae bacterium]|nr:Flp pilus assembly complex ATPase component TadA [Phycisphaeraceae bacterium]MCB9847947.1 Flp pilus assembly complex ATPase component TadA [Phycisphaeraceae bacterium]
MGKIDIDNLLSDLGFNEDEGEGVSEAHFVDPTGREPDGDDAGVSPFSETIDYSGEPEAPAPGEMFYPHGAPPEAPRDPDAGLPDALTSIYTPEQPQAHAKRDLGAILVEREIITGAQLSLAKGVMAQTPGSALVDVLVNQDADEVGIQRIVAELAGLPFEALDPELGDRAVCGKHIQRLSTKFCKKQQILPLREEGIRLVVGVIKPDEVFQLDDVKRRLGVASIKPVVISRGDLHRMLELFGEPDQQEMDLEDILSDIQEDDVQIAEDEVEELDLEKQAAESPVIRYVNYILQTASKEGASDIHIEPGERGIKVRLRIDGILFESMNPPAAMAAAIASRLKIMANLDIAERRLPQDGRIRCNIQGRKLDLRMSTLPTAHGEKIVLRILDTRSINVKLEDLGLDENTLRIWNNQVAEPNGIILVTGPTGSGKTTTLYASLRQMDKQKMNISTVEDPIEYQLDGVTQTQTHDRIGMTFAKALKALLRQDPDVVLIGEIRDLDTATTAVQAALTGHLVLSTLHTNDAPSSVTRLVNIGIEPFLVGAALNGVLAQRLVRRICQHCKQHIKPIEELGDFLEMHGLDRDTIVEGAGCEHCRNTGYSGRLGIYELLVVDDTLRDMIARNPNVSEFRRMCLERGMNTLREDGMNKVRAELTTVQEIRRVTESGH